MKKTKIVCTIGPASESKEVFKELVINGLNVARLNFSHGSHEEHLQRIKMIKEVREELKTPVAILLDTKGPEIRTGKFELPSVDLVEGQEFTLYMDEMMGTDKGCSISYTELTNDVEPGDSILIDDGLIGLEVLEIKDREILTKVLNGGTVKNNKGINVPGVIINLPAITEKDASDIKFGIRNGIDFIAASFIRKKEDVLEIRKILEDNDAGHIQIISKIENQEGVDNLDEIIEISDGLMVARGDLGVEIPTEEIPLVQKDMIRKCNIACKPVITATQMLDSMIRNPRPTRAETTDVANAIYDGTDAIMLSGETAAGKYPLEAVKTMAVIAKATENSLDYAKILREKSLTKEPGVTYAVSHATCETASALSATAIMTATSSGFTARKISQFRPKSNIVAVTTTERVSRQLILVWGVFPIVAKEVESTDEIFDLCIEEGQKLGYVNEGDLVVITAGVPVGVAGATNLMKVHLVGEMIIKGTGIGKIKSSGRACIVKDANEAREKFEDGDIIVCHSSDKDLVPYIERSAGLITEEGGYTSHGAIVGLNLGKAVLVGIEDVKDKIRDGQILTIDSSRGLAFSGKTREL